MWVLVFFCLENKQVPEQVFRIKVLHLGEQKIALGSSLKIDSKHLLWSCAFPKKPTDSENLYLRKKILQGVDEKQLNMYSQLGRLCGVMTATSPYLHIHLTLTARMQC